MLESLFRKVAGLQACEICEILRTPILKNICEQLLVGMTTPIIFRFAKYNRVPGKMTESENVSKA